MLATAISNAQTTATNWTANDCDGISHTLFSELDSGKVIVFAWVMPCVSCINPSKTAYNTVQTYATSNPGKVRFYLADDLGDASCATLTSWVTTNSIGSTSNMKIFSNAGNLIDENNFGGTGMPHIIVMGGPSHTIFFNKKGSAANDATGITTAINSAIGAAGVRQVSHEAAFTVSPNPATDRLSINGSRAVRSIRLTLPNGQVVRELNFTTARTNPETDISQLASGIYMVSITDADGITSVHKVIKQ